ncbi:DUF192 domain-containing protein [Candidatus Woesearchaeota archaeon]|nr:DUF192 domain-containing protein [Candidatus Woesearchaeota archaeon]
MHQKKYLNFPNLITFLRLPLGILILFFSYFGKIYSVIVFYAAAIITDNLDGMIARLQGQTTSYGAKLDILADNFIMLCLIVSIYFFNSVLMLKYLPKFGFVFTYFLIAQFILRVSDRGFAIMKTPAALLAASVFPFVYLSMLFYEVKLLIYIYLILMLYSLTEKLFLKMSRSKKKTIFRLSVKKIALFIIILLLLIIVLISVPLIETGDKACFQDGYCINLEVKDTPEERALGLMYRESIEEDEGMLFVFDTPDRYSFWMKNMLIYIDMIFLDADKKVIYIADSVPPCTDDPCSRYTPGSPALYVIETKAGFSRRHGIQEGDVVEFYI